MPSPGKIALTIHVDLKTKERLDMYTKQLDVSLTWLCTQAINQYLESLPEVEDAALQIINTRGE